MYIEYLFYYCYSCHTQAYNKENSTWDTLITQHVYMYLTHMGGIQSAGRTAKNSITHQCVSTAIEQKPKAMTG